MNQDLTERELDELMALYQDGCNWNSHRLAPAIPYLIQELRRRRGTTGPTMERDRRNSYPRSNNSQQQNRQQGNRR